MLKDLVKGMTYQQNSKVWRRAPDCGILTTLPNNPPFVRVIHLCYTMIIVGKQGRTDKLREQMIPVELPQIGADSAYYT